MSEVRVAVVTPVHNGGRYLSQCIESVLGQTYQNWSYVIVDNFSDDDSGVISEAFARRDPRIRVVHTTRLLPVVENFNFALRQMDPESAYLKMLMADDWLEPDCLERMVALARTSDRIGLVGALWSWNGEPRPRPDTLDFESDILPGTEVCRKRLRTGLSLHGSPTSVLIRADLVRQDPEFFNEGNLRTDSEAFFKVLQVSDFGFIREVLAHQRDHPASVSSRHAGLGTNMLGNYHLARRFAPIVFSDEEGRTVLRDRTTVYYTYLLTLLLFGRRRTLAYHVRGLRKLGHRIEIVEVVRALRFMLRHAWGLRAMVRRGLRLRAPMEFYLAEFSVASGRRRSGTAPVGSALQQPADEVCLGADGGGGEERH